MNGKKDEIGLRPHVVFLVFSGQENGYDYAHPHNHNRAYRPAEIILLIISYFANLAPNFSNPCLHIIQPGTHLFQYAFNFAYSAFSICCHLHDNYALDWA